MGVSEAQQTACQSVNAHHWLYHIKGQRRLWLMGMTWIPVIGKRAQRDILLSQRQQHATHYVQSAPNQTSIAGVMGVATLPASLSLPNSDHSTEWAGAELISAALCLAAQYAQQTHVFVLQVSAQSWWFVAVHHGSVVCQTDVWYDNPDAVQGHIEQLQARFTGLQIHEFIDGQCPQFVQDLMAGQTQLTPLKKITPYCALTRLAALAGVTVLGLVVFAMFLGVPFDRLPFHRLPIIGGLFVEPGNPDLSHIIDPDVPMKPTDPVESHPYEALTQIVEQWHTLPIDPSGWMLKHIHCEGQRQTFVCRARYGRDRPDANNAQLERALPDTWTFVPDSLDQVTAVKAFDVTLQTHDASALDRDADWLSPLQQRQAVFQSLHVGNVQTATQASEVLRRQIRIVAPLRSLSALSGFTQPIQWHQANLEVIDQTTIDHQHSHFILHLTGDLLAKS